jgi:endonuclease YncB( thermonuclease family)
MLRRAAESRRRRHLWVPALFLCLLATGCTRAGAPASDCDIEPSQGSIERISRVVDGDTVHLAGGDRVRLIGLNTPELGRDGNPPEPLAREAREALAALTGASGRVLLVEGRDGRDRHGRRLAHLYGPGGRNLTAHMLRQGMGFHVAVAPNFTHLECLRAAEAEARAARVGVWSEPAHGALSVDQFAPDRGGFTRVRGRVTRVSFKSNGWWVQLDGKLGLQIKPADQHLFSRSALQRLEGETLEARGWLVPMKGGWWLMNIGHPAMLETER